MLISLFILNGCSNDDDDYSLGKRWETFATVYPTSEHSYYLIFDNNEKVGIAASNGIYKPKENQRIYLNFTYLPDATGEYDHLIKVNWLSEILTKEIIDLNSENQDSIGNDPVRIHSLWIGDDYLNIRFGYNYGRQATHFINLVNNTVFDPDPANDGKVYLEFRHNKNNDPEWYGQKAFVSFNLRKYRQEAEAAGKDSVHFVISVKDFGEEYKKYDIVYKVKENTADVLPSLSYDSNENYDATLFR